jgi:hypothetical protein
MGDTLNLDNASINSDLESPATSGDHALTDFNQELPHILSFLGLRG